MTEQASTDDLIERLETAIADYRAGDLGPSREQLLRLAIEDSDNGDVWYYLGLTAFWLKDLDAAKTELERAVQLESQANALYYLGEIARQRGQMQEAIQYFQSVLRVAPEHPEARAVLGILVQQEPAGRGTPPPPPTKTTMPRGEKGARFIKQAMQQKAKAPGAIKTAPGEADGPAPVDPLAGLAMQPRPRGIFGRVLAVQPIDLTSLTFRMTRWSESGEAGPVVEVDMRGPFRRGSVQPGDWVQLPVDDPPQRPVDRIMNLSTGQPVTMPWVGAYRFAGVLFVLLLGSAVVGFLIFVTGGIAAVPIAVVAVVAIVLAIRRRRALRL